MAALWFLVITLCPMGDQDDCQDYITDGELSYSDCLLEAAKQPVSDVIYAVACKRGVKIESKDIK